MKNEGEARLRKILERKREERLARYNELKKAGKDPNTDAEMKDIIFRGKRIRAALDFMDGKIPVGSMDPDTSKIVISSIFE